MRGGVILKHFSARDVVSRWDVLEVHRRATSLPAARFLDTLLDRVPFPIKCSSPIKGNKYWNRLESRFESCVIKSRSKTP